MLRRKKTRKTKLIIFDFDGVIVDTSDLVFEVYQLIYKRYGLKKLDSQEDLKKLFDNNIPETIAYLGVKRWKIPIMIMHGIIKGRRYSSKVSPCPGIEEVIKELSKEYRLIILTSALGYSVKKYLNEKNLLQYFEAVLGFEKQRSKDRSFKKILIKYKVDKENVLFITDTVGDILEAKKNNLKVVGVGYGFQGKERLAKENPDYMIDCAREIVEVVNSHFQEIDKERLQGQQLDKLAI